MEKNERTMPWKVVHLITGTGTGGAESMLARLVERMDRNRFTSSVVSMLPEGPTAEKIRRSGIAVTSLGMSRGVPDPRAMTRLVRFLRNTSPHILQTWMYHADLLGGVVGKMLGLPVLWNIRHANLDESANKAGTLAVVSLCAHLSGRIPVHILCNSEMSRTLHISRGYAAEKFTVIPNGFDLERFAPDDSAAARVRAEFSIPSGMPPVGLVARFDPQKDHGTFFRAVSLFRGMGGRATFLLCGDGVTLENPAFRACVESSLSEAERSDLRFLGRRDDVPRLSAAFDLATLSSRGESFPNVIGEAMACGVPVAATDVGDVRFIVGDTGLVVPAGDPHALATAWRSLLAESGEVRRRRGEAARARIWARFDLRAVVASYETLYEETLLGSPPKKG